ncbi:GNAT family N-acetyltransferase [soil metagenome]
MRAAGPSDAVTITEYHHRCWREGFAPLLKPGVVAAIDPWGKLDRWRQWLAPGSGLTTWVADLGDQPVGHTTVSGHELVHLFVDPDHWSRGLGRALLEVGENLIRTAGHRQAELHTIVGNEPALALYRSTGWVVTDRLVHNDLNGVVYDEHVLIKDLAASERPA